MSAYASSYILQPVCVLACLALTLSGCIHGTEERHMNDGITLESSYTAAIDPAKNITDTEPKQAQEKEKQQIIFDDIRWWTLYDDPDLNALITHALSNNPSLAQIRARLKQASTLKDKYSASLWPSLNISTTRSTYNGSTNVHSDFDLAGIASYEVDLWGENHAIRKTYTLEEQASRENLHSAAITLSANIVDLWLQILSLIEQETLLRKQIETNQTIYGLQQKRFEMGAATALDVLQQEEAVSAAKAKLPDILSAQAQTVNALSLLIGESPSQTITVHARSLPDALPMPNSGIPSDLMQNRPDIVAAWLHLLSNDWAIKVAQTNRLPSFNLSGVYTSSNSKLSGLFDSWLLTLAGELAAPVLDGGALATEQRYQQALADEAYHTYREVVLVAVSDVENALVKNRYQDEKLTALQQQLRATRETLEQAQISYANGQSTYINVLISMNSVHSLEQQLISARLTQAQARVSLYRALGGQGWESIVPNITTLMSYPGSINSAHLQQKDHKEMEKKEL
ncbi:MAG: efflux transporter outer membrane subunit [Alphaproteobacteria bacterium]|nr:efflux transporter outer membrane subunit [Alphaproteobacteria bacterium]